MDLSVCGLVCSECAYHPKECGGCREVEGRPFWVDPGSTGCELYQCSIDKQYDSCGDCAELPCKQFRELKDPNISDAEHLEELGRRVERLRKA